MTILRTALSWVLYYIGDVISYPMLWFDLGFIYPVYNRVMGWSVELDREERVWKSPSPEEGENK